MGNRTDSRAEDVMGRSIAERRGKANRSQGVSGRLRSRGEADALVSAR